MNKKLYVSYHPYMDDSSGFHEFEYTSLVDGLTQICDFLLYGTIKVTKDEIIKDIVESNGDGCAYIFSIISSDGEIIFHV